MSDFKIFPKIRRFREAKGFSIKTMTDKSGIPSEHYRNIEAGFSEIDPDEFEIIAKILDVPKYKLKRPAHQLQRVRFCSNKKLKNRKLVILEVEHWLNDYNLIEELLDDCRSNPLLAIRSQICDMQKTISEVAKLTREKFGLSANIPISNIGGVLESNGIKIGKHLVKSHDFFGLSIGPEDGGPAIIVNTWNQIPVERWIFTLAHELGHLVLHQTDYNIGQVKSGRSHENEANVFASEFLMPEKYFKRVWKEFRGLSFVERVLTVKRIFRVSYKSVLYRYATLNPDSKNVWVKFKTDYKKSYKRSKFRKLEFIEQTKDELFAGTPEFNVQYEPERLSHVDFNCCRFVGLVKTALEEHKISIGRGAEILQISHQNLRDLANSW